MSQSPDPEVLAEAIRRLSQRSLSEHELRAKLAKHGALVEAVVNHLVSKGLLNDNRVAEAISRQANEGGRSDAWVSHQLVEKGLEQASGLNSEFDRARRAIERKRPKHVGRFLAGRGFAEDTIASIIEEANDV
ncbi:MAG: regulatory protein RecX [Chthonomonas sp.]|nr:regulatory protein RecX [Chthonomonas sp.]